MTALCPVVINKLRLTYSITGYGMTEVLITHATPLNNPKIGFCGMMMPHVSAKVINIDTGASLPANKKGELLIKTPCVSFVLSCSYFTCYFT